MKRWAILFLIFLWPMRLMAAQSAQAIPILLDTDIGSDIDDAFALALVLNSPELDLVGVTTVSGDAEARARLAAKLLEDAGRLDVPVVAGAPGKPLPIAQCRLADGFTSPSILPARAEDFMKSEIDLHAGEIVIVAIGPLTNVAALLKKHPEAAKKIRQIVLMGGSIERGYAPGSKPEPEYNIRSDSDSAQAVFASGVPILMVPLDVTAMLKLDPEARHSIFTGLTPLTNDLTLLYHLWDHETPTLFDPMAVAELLDPILCETRPMAIEVDNQGFTRIAEGKHANATVALHTDPAKFFQFYLSRVAPNVPSAAP